MCDTLVPKASLNQSQGTVYKISHMVLNTLQSGRSRMDGENQGGAAEMAWQVRPLTALAEDPGFIPRSHVVAQNHCNSSFRGSSFGLCRHQDCTWYINMKAQYLHI